MLRYLRDHLPLVLLQGLVPEEEHVGAQHCRAWHGNFSCVPWNSNSINFNADFSNLQMQKYLQYKVFCHQYEERYCRYIFPFYVNDFQRHGTIVPQIMQWEKTKTILQLSFKKIWWQEPKRREGGFSEISPLKTIYTFNAERGQPRHSNFF